jgi:catechol 2,3-dioxygenase-like lactoylglutathione lyase family enzyme
MRPLLVGGVHAAYVLAGELAAARGDYRVAFDRYERLLRPYVARGQKQARGGRDFLAPATAKKIRQHDDVEAHHYAFLVSEEEFDAAFARIQDRGVTFFADPSCRQAGQIYHGKGGHRGTYFRDPDGHLMEVLTPAG